MRCRSVRFPRPGPAHPPTIPRFSACPPPWSQSVPPPPSCIRSPREWSDPMPGPGPRKSAAFPPRGCRRCGSVPAWPRGAPDKLPEPSGESFGPVPSPPASPAPGPVPPQRTAAPPGHRNPPAESRSAPPYPRASARKSPPHFSRSVSSHCTSSAAVRVSSSQARRTVSAAVPSAPSESSTFSTRTGSSARASATYCSAAEGR